MRAKDAPASRAAYAGRVTVPAPAPRLSKRERERHEMEEFRRRVDAALDRDPNADVEAIIVGLRAELGYPRSAIAEYHRKFFGAVAA